MSRSKKTQFQSFSGLSKSLGQWSWSAFQPNGIVQGICAELGSRRARRLQFLVPRVVPNVVCVLQVTWCEGEALQLGRIYIWLRTYHVQSSSSNRSTHRRAQKMVTLLLWRVLEICWAGTVVHVWISGFLPLLEGVRTCSSTGPNSMSFFTPMQIMQ